MLPNQDEIVTTLRYASGIAWDTCHKIYVLMDEEQMSQMASYGYDPLISKREATPDQMLTLIQTWWDESCGLRFIEAVQTNKEDPNRGFTTLVGQGEEDEVDNYA